MLTFRTIVVALDFGPTSRDAVELAANLARDHPDCQLHLLHVVDEPVCDAWAVDAPEVKTGTLRKRWLENAQERLEEVAGSLDLEPARAVCAAIEGTPHSDVTRYARAHHADLLIVGSHGYGAVKRLLLGSVAEQVLRQASCPVLVVPHEELRVSAIETASRSIAAP